MISASSGPRTSAKLCLRRGVIGSPLDGWVATLRLGGAYYNCSQQLPAAQLHEVGHDLGTFQVAQGSLPGRTLTVGLDLVRAHASSRDQQWDRSIRVRFTRAARGMVGSNGHDALAEVELG